MSIAAIVVTYNRKELLLECVESLRAQTCKDLDILIVDNASTDGTKEALSELIDEGIVLYENTGANLGGAGGFEYGVRKAVEAGYDYLWIMDDDSIPYPAALEELVKAAERVPGFGWLSSTVLWKDGTLCSMNIQRDQKLRPLQPAGGQDLIPAGGATFVSLFFPASVVRAEGLPIGAFFIWADDLEYTRRISLKYPCYVVPASVVLHKCATNNGSNISTDEESKIPRYRYAYRNEVVLYRREGIRGFLHVLMRTPLHIMRVLRYSKSKKLARIRVILGATAAGLRFRPEVKYPQA